MEILKKSVQYFCNKRETFLGEKRNGQMERISFTDENNSYSSFGMTRALVLLCRIVGDSEIYAIVGVINQKRSSLERFFTNTSCGRFCKCFDREHLSYSASACVS